MLKKIKEWLEIKTSKNKVGRPKLAEKSLKKSVKIEIALAFVLCTALVLSGASALTGKSPLELIGLNDKNSFLGDVIENNPVKIYFPSKTSGTGLTIPVNRYNTDEEIRLKYGIRSYSDSATQCPKVADADTTKSGIQDKIYEKRMQNFDIVGNKVYFSFPIRGTLEKEQLTETCIVSSATCTSCQLTKAVQSELYKNQSVTAVIIRKIKGAKDVVIKYGDAGHAQTFEIETVNGKDYIWSNASARKPISTDNSSIINGKEFLFPYHFGSARFAYNDKGQYSVTDKITFNNKSPNKSILRVPSSTVTNSYSDTELNITNPELAIYEDENNTNRLISIRSGYNVKIFTKKDFIDKDKIFTPVASFKIEEKKDKNGNNMLVQGTDIDDKYYYQLYGSLNGDSYITAYDFKGNKVYEIEITIDYLKQKTILGTKDQTKVSDIEAEGLKVYDHGIYYGIVYKYDGGQYNNIYYITKADIISKSNIAEKMRIATAKTTTTTTTAKTVADNIGRFSVQKVLNTNCYDITKPLKIGNNWRVHLYYKELGDTVSNRNQIEKYSYDYPTASKVRVCFEKQRYNNETFRILVKVTDKINSDAIIKNPSSTEWQPLGYRYDYEIEWSSKDYEVNW